MNKSKDKHHLPEEVKKTAKATDNPAPADVEPANEAPAAAAPTEADPGYAVGFAEARNLKKAEQEIAQHKDQLLRLRADFENYRKRVLREKGEIYENANEALMLELLPVIDHFQLALNSAKEHLVLSGVEGQAHQTFQEGIRMIFDQLLNILLKYGLNPFDSEKQPFDPNLHEAINYLPSETEPEGTILAQSRPGYRFNNKMLRPAQVVVSSGKPAPLQGEIKENPA